MISKYRTSHNKSIISPRKGIENDKEHNFKNNATLFTPLLKEMDVKNFGDLQNKYSFFRSLEPKDNSISDKNITNDSDPSIPTFREFVLYVSDLIVQCRLSGNSTCLDQVDVHWQPYYNRCIPCNINYAVIAKVSTSLILYLDVEISFISSSISISSNSV